LGRITTSGGMAIMHNVHYASDWYARAYKAVIVSAAGTPQNIASGHVQLSVGKVTMLLLDVTRDFNSSNHVFNCKLLYDSSPVNGKTVKLKLNETEYSNSTINGLAKFVLWLSP
jgi:hypothetical protein